MPPRPMRLTSLEDPIALVQLAWGGPFRHLEDERQPAIERLDHSRSRRWLNQSTHSSVANSTSWRPSRATAADQLGLVQPDDDLGQGVVERVTATVRKRNVDTHEDLTAQKALLDPGSASRRQLRPGLLRHHVRGIPV